MFGRQEGLKVDIINSFEVQIPEFWCSIAFVLCGLLTQRKFLLSKVTYEVGADSQPVISKDYTRRICASCNHISRFVAPWAALIGFLIVWSKGSVSQGRTGWLVHQWNCNDRCRFGRASSSNIARFSVTSSFHFFFWGGDNDYHFLDFVWRWWNSMKALSACNSIHLQVVVVGCILCMIPWIAYHTLFTTLLLLEEQSSALKKEIPVSLYDAEVKIVSEVRRKIPTCACRHKIICVRCRYRRHHSWGFHLSLNTTKLSVLLSTMLRRLTHPFLALLQVSCCNFIMSLL